MLAFINKFICLYATKKTAEKLADLKYKYGKKGIIMSLADFMISAQVIENNGTLVTKDRIFEKIEEMDKIIL
jgi:predicted nucleic acid-binding protein